jgi:hypothetical protein
MANSLNFYQCIKVQLDEHQSENIGKLKACIDTREYSARQSRTSIDLF